MINVKEMKRSITQNQIIALMASAGVDYNYCRDNEIHFRSACHDSNSYKLYAYKDKEWSLFCHRCAEQHDIIGIVQHLKHYSFLDALNYVCDVLGIDGGSFQKRQKDVYDWQKDIGMYLHNEPQEVELRVFDESVLEFLNCGNVVVEDWIKDGISPLTQKKFGIGWYPLHNSIIIPCKDDNDNFIGCRERFLRPEDCESGKYRPLRLLGGKQYNFPTNCTFYGTHQNQAAIKRKKEVWLLEGEKSVLKFDTWFGDDNVALAMYGSNLGKRRRDYLLTLGVERVIIMIDSDFHTIGDEEYFEFEKKVFKMADILKGFFDISVCYNNQGYDGYKFAPCDFSREQFDKLYEEREIIE